MKPRFLATFTILIGLLAGTAHADTLLGRWTCEFDSQIGVQKYVFEFTENAGRVTGFATFERSLGNGKVELKDIYQVGEKVSFVEPFSFDGNEIAIRYSGTLAGDEMKLRRDVGDFATEHIVAKRAE